MGQSVTDRRGPRLPYLARATHLPAWWSRRAAPPRVPVRLLRGGEPGSAATWRVPRGEMLAPPSSHPALPGEARYLFNRAGPRAVVLVPSLVFFSLAPHRRRERKGSEVSCCCFASAPTAFQSTDARAPSCLTTATGTGSAAAGAPTSSRSSTPPWRSRTWPESARPTATTSAAGARGGAGEHAAEP
jgi:hypothetical protein